MDFLESVKAGDVATVKRALAENPSLANQQEDGSSVLCIAIFYGHPEVAQAMVEFGHTPNLFEAAAIGDAARIAEILTADPTQLNEIGADGFHALGLACAFGHVDAVAAILNFSPDTTIETTNPNVKVAPIHSAAFGRNAEVMQMLLSHGADPNLRVEGGFVALHTAAQNGDIAIVDLLCAHGADGTLLANDGKSAADFAREAGHTDLANRLASE